MTHPPSRPTVLGLHASISDYMPNDLRGVDVLADELGRRLAGPHRRLEGREGPFELTPSAEDLAASRGVLQAAADHVTEAVRAGEVPVTLATDCSLAIGTLPAVAAAVEGVRVLWLDAHADYDTPATQTIDFLGCMSLAGACGEWETGMGTLSAGQVVHVGARANPGDFDYAGQEQGRAELGAMLPADATSEQILTALGHGPVYVHLDPDVLDPTVNPIWYGRPGGLSAERLLELLGEVHARRQIVGLEVTAFHSSDEDDERERVCTLLGKAVETLVG